MIYFDNAATTYPKPISTIDALKKAVLIYGGNPGRGGHELSLRTSEKIYNIRKKIAEFFNADLENIVFTNNCTMSLNMAIKGVMENGGNVVISSFEHNSVIRPIYALKDKGITCSVAEVYQKSEDEIVEEFKNLIKEDTKLVVCTHASNVVGNIMPIKGIGKICRERNIAYIVDASQTAGIIDLDVKENHIDILCTAGHKGLYGITGTGLMIINEQGKKINIATIVEGGTGSISNDIVQPNFTPDRFESGTINTVGICSLESGIDFIKLKGIKDIYIKEYVMCKKVYNELVASGGYEVYSSEYEEGKTAPIVAFNVEGMHSEAVAEYLSNRGYCLRGGLQCSMLAHTSLKTISRGVVRFSPSSFNNLQEIELFIKDLQNIKKCKK